ncbi:MAG: hypothetical protein WD225_14980, partial [Ilumatobacteraceae bacterium]
PGSAPRHGHRHPAADRLEAGTRTRFHARRGAHRPALQERDGLKRFPRRFAAVALVATVVAACGEPATIPELTATPLPATPAADPPLDDPVPEVHVDAEALTAGDTDAEGDGHEASTEPVDDAPGPAPPSRDAQRAEFLYEHIEDAPAADHLSTDLLGDAVPELVLATLTVDGVLEVTLAAWAGNRYEPTGTVTAGAAHRPGTPVARDLTGDGRLEIVVPFTAQGGPTVLAVAVADDGVLEVPSRCPVAEPSPHRLRLRTSRAATAVVLTCDARAVADDRVVLSWRDGLFVVAPDPVGDADPDRGSEGEGPGSEGKGPGGKGPGGEDTGRPPHAGPPDDPPALGRGRGHDEDRPGRGARD